MARAAQKADNVVIGAGILGVSCALHLQKLGLSVVLVDRGAPGDGASFGNAGVLAASSVVPVPTPGILSKAPAMLFGTDGPLFLKWGYVPRMLPWLVQYLKTSKRETVEYISRHLAPLVANSFDEHKAVAAGTPAEKWIRPLPYLFVYKDKAGFEADGFGWRLRRKAGFVGEQLEAGELHALEPALSPDYGFGVLLHDHGMIANPGQYVKDLAAAFAAQGGDIVTGEILDIEPGERSVALKLADRTLDARSIVLAAGVWSEKFAQKLGVTVRLESERGYHIELEGASVKPSMPILDTRGKFVATPMDTGLRIAGLVEFGGVDAPASKAPIELLVRGARKLLPGLHYSGRREWLGHRPATTDSLPVLGRSPRHSNVYFAYGHHHVGLTAGPKSGRVVAQQIAGLTPNIDLGAYRADRAA